MADDEVVKAWEALKKKKGKSEEKSEEKEEEEKEKEKTEEEKAEEEKTGEEKNLEEAIVPKEMESFSVIPGKAPSLEISENLESAVGAPSRRGEEKEEKKETPYVIRHEEERKYERPLISLSEMTPEPRMFEKFDIAEMAKGRMTNPLAQRTLERDYLLSDNLGTKWLPHERMDREKKEKMRKYTPAM